MTREALNILAQLAWNKPADEAFLSAYEGKEPSAVLGDVLDSAANIWLRTKASQFDGVWNALQGEYAKDRLSPDATQVIADVQAALDKHKLAS